MHFARIFSAQTSGLTARTIRVEVDISTQTLHACSIVGLPDKAVEEAKDRISAAIKNAGLTSPKQDQQKVVISLAPAHLRKEGAHFDVAMALGYLLARDDIDFDPTEKLFLGELALDGSVRSITGILPLIAHAKKYGFKEVYVPRANTKEAGLVHGITVYGINTLQEVIDAINIRSKKQTPLVPILPTRVDIHTPRNTIDMKDIHGQENAKRALTIAASGGHNIALFGPPGTGKTLLAKACAHILPELNERARFETTSIHSIAGILEETAILYPPFRAPHHTSSHTSIIGGGSYPKPGEITLAHNGILFLDEFPEFDRRVIESLREPLEENVIRISRSKGSETFPARIMLIAALNPCPCGYFGIEGKQCTCSAQSLERYRKKLSGPIMDRIDMWVEVSQVAYDKLHTHANETPSITFRESILRAQQQQHNRYKHTPIRNNSDLSPQTLTAHAPLDTETRELLTLSAKQLDLSARAYHRIIKLARTIADIEGEKDIQKAHILEALQYRPKQIKV